MFVTNIIIITLVLLYIHWKKCFNYWGKRNVTHDPPMPIFGNHFKNQFRLRNITQVSTYLYDKYSKERVVGYYSGTTPMLFVKDLDIVKRVLSVEFDKFCTRGVSRNANVEPLFKNIFHADEALWRELRHRLTPAFTIARLKAMFPLILGCVEKLQGAGERIVASGGDCDVRELMTRFTTDFIGACGFGIEIDSLNDEHSQFRKLGKLISDPPLKERIYRIIWEMFPIVRSFLYVGDNRVEKYIKSIVKQIAEQRDNVPSGRNDFIDLLLELKSQGKLLVDAADANNPDATLEELEQEMELKFMAAQVFIFFVAGFETSAAAMTFTLHEIAHEPEIQRQIQENIDAVLIKYNNKLCYDAVTDMTKLNMAFYESMRLIAPSGVLFRECTKLCTIPELDITLDPGVKIAIPVQAIQNDQNYYDNPTQFRLDRFEPEAVRERTKFSFLSFGEGPRKCIGYRLGEMQSMAGLAALLHKYTVELTPSTERRPALNPEFCAIVQR